MLDNLLKQCNENAPESAKPMQLAVKLGLSQNKYRQHKKFHTQNVIQAISQLNIDPELDSLLWQITTTPLSKCGRIADKIASYSSDPLAKNNGVYNIPNTNLSNIHIGNNVELQKNIVQYANKGIHLSEIPIGNKHLLLALSDVSIDRADPTYNFARFRGSKEMDNQHRALADTYSTQLIITGDKYHAQDQMSRNSPDPVNKLFPTSVPGKNITPQQAEKIMNCSVDNQASAPIYDGFLVLKLY